MDTVSETFELFDKHVPHGQEAFLVVKAQLLVEMRLRDFVKARISDASLLKDVFCRDSPVRSGKGLIILARSLADRDEIKFSTDNVQWKAIDILNNLRNDLAHELEPNSESITKKMQNFIVAMGACSDPMQARQAAAGRDQPRGPAPAPGAAAARKKRLQPAP